ncbi:serine protease [Kitasatospora sp. RB6PN24]|uniref:serine protease n=1 Tax=Kitasatospora humi TaxID=2893891 RepID=UPI001E3F7127|nr:serine protease [Kitasatospora humi]MCC9311389.1 serine protease [Kitasatospora humi]
MTDGRQPAGTGSALDLGAVLRLTARQLAGAAAGPGRIAELAADRVDRPDGLAGEEPGTALTVLVGEPGSGRSTELAALVVRRTGGARPLPTLWLRGADLRPGDATLLPAVRRALGDAVPPPAVAAVCAAAGRPLLVLLDGPEEAPAVLDPAWWAAALPELTGLGVRLLVACRPESWEPPPGVGPVRLHRLGPLHGEALDRAARRYGVPVPTAAADPLRLRLAGDLRAAGITQQPCDQAELVSGWVDLRCLRAAQRIAEETARPASHRKGAPAPATAAVTPGLVRRLAAAVAGRLHTAARRMLGPGQGALSRADFAELFPVGGGWARAVLAERLLVPAGDGYRPAHETVSDWLQGRQLDLDAALGRLLAAPPRPGLPHHRIGVVAAALGAVGDRGGAAALEPWLRRLWRAVTDPAAGPEARWWATRLLRAALAGSPAPTAHRALLTALAERLAADGPHSALTGFGPDFWAGLALPDPLRWELLGVLVRADGPEQAHLQQAAARLRADGPAALPHLCRWLADGRGLPARPGVTVADLVQDLLYAHRALAIDELTEALVAAAHPRADALLTVLAVEEPSALCRAVDRWSHDPRPERHVAAAVHGLRTAPYAGRTGRELLRFTALTLLAREGEPQLHGAALALLVRDPLTRSAHLMAALAAYAADDPFVTPEVLGLALASHPAAVLTAFEARLARPDGVPGPVLRVLAEAAPLLGGANAASALPDPATRLAGRLLHGHPEWAEPVAEYLSRRLTRQCAGPGDLTALLGAAPGLRPPAVRRAFALVLAQPAAGQPLRRAFLDRLLASERDPAVLGPLLRRVAQHADREQPERSRAVVRRIADLWPREDGGAAGLDALLVRCAGHSAGFARLLAEWPLDARPPAGGPRLRRMRALPARGRDPQYAAAEAERAPVVALPLGSGGVPVPGRLRAHGTL